MGRKPVSQMTLGEKEQEFLEALSVRVIARVRTCRHARIVAEHQDPVTEAASQHPSGPAVIAADPLTVLSFCLASCRPFTTTASPP